MDFGILVDVAIGVLMVLVMFSIATSAVNEFLADWLFRLRGRSLAEAIEKLMAREIARGGKTTDRFTAEDLREAFFADPDIRVLMHGARLPSAIEGRRYALTALKLLFERHELRDALDERLAAARVEAQPVIQETAHTLGLDDTGDAVSEKLGKGIALVKRFGDESVETIDAMIARLEGEFDELMDRVSGWYLRRTKVMLFAIGLVLAVGSNIDLLGYADRMLTTDSVSTRIDEFAQVVDSGKWQALITALDERTQATLERVAGAHDASAASAQVSGGTLPRPTDAVFEGSAGTVDASKIGAVADPPDGRAPKTESNEPDSSVEDELGQLIGELEALDVKVGWDCIAVPKDRGILFGSERYCIWRTGEAGAEVHPRLGLPVPTASQAVGWILIAFGVTFGAQMWFDLVRRLVRLRTSGLTGGAATRAAEA